MEQEKYIQKCVICQRLKTENSKYCRYHKLADEKLVQSYNDWAKAYKQLDWKEYLRRLCKNKETGEWIMEVAIYRLQNND